MSPEEVLSPEEVMSPKEVLSPEEVMAVIQEKMGFDENMARYLVQMFDQNQDGSLDKGEFVQLWAAMFGH